MLMVDNTSIMAHHDAELEGGGDHLIDRLLAECYRKRLAADLSLDKERLNSVSSWCSALSTPGCASALYAQIIDTERED